MTARRVPCSAFTVEIEGVAGPAAFKQLPDALEALWESMRALPLGWTQYDAYRFFLTRPDAEERVIELLDRNGRLDLSFAMAGRSHFVRVERSA